MHYYQQTGIYQKWLTVINLFVAQNNPQSLLIFEKIENALIDIATQIATALIQENREKTNAELKIACQSLFPLKHLIDLAVFQKAISTEFAEQLTSAIDQFQTDTEFFMSNRPNILILSSIFGQGHMSAAKSIKNGLHELYGQNYNVMIVDFFEQVASFLNKATAKAYESSTKHTPKLWQYFFESTDRKWAVKFINLINYPLASSKIEKFFESQKPDIVISTYPFWDYLASLVLKKFNYLRFISVVTDSISIHTAWNCADLDYHIVANPETAISLRKIGVAEKKIKILGFPVSTEFMKPIDRKSFIQSQGLNPKKYTVLLLPTAEKPKVTIKTMELIQKSFPEINLITICGRNAELYPKLAKHPWPENFKIISWTNQMPSFIKSSDLVITKAGGATVMECVAAKKPMIITQIIPGQEMGNAELIKIYNLGIIQKQFSKDITECISYIQNNQQQFLDNFKTISNPDSAIKIGKFIDQLLHEKSSHKTISQTHQTP